MTAAPRAARCHLRRAARECRAAFCSVSAISLAPALATQTRMFRAVLSAGLVTVVAARTAGLNARALPQPLALRADKQAGGHFRRPPLPR